MSKPTNIKELRAKAELFDELVEQLTVAEDELDRVRTTALAGLDPAWREIANDLAAALRPYTLFQEQKVEDGRIVVHTRVPGATLRAGREALDRLGRQVARGVLPALRHPGRWGRALVRSRSRAA